MAATNNTRPAGQRLVVGVDFGTTNSGVSWAVTGGQDTPEVVCITQWPGAASNEHREKCPSRVAYLHEQPGHSGPPPNRDVMWGYEVDPGMKSYSWMKLLLDQHALQEVYKNAGHLSSLLAGALALPRGKTAEDVVTDYLRELYQHSMAKIGEDTGSRLLAVTPIDFWFTMPAIWSDAAQAATKRAARAAGFGSRAEDTITMVLEPEAAAITTLKFQNDGLEGSLQVGQGILICDCGGGTVDITSYAIAQKEPYLDFSELCVGTGAACGSTLIDRNLLRLMQQRFGEAFDSLPAERYAPGSRFMKDFEDIKSRFGSSDTGARRRNNQRIRLRLSGLTLSRHYDPSEDEVILSQEDLKILFDPAVAQIRELVSEQINEVRRVDSSKRISTIFLVGGFGESGYLYSQMKQAFEPRGIVVQRPHNAWSAVVRGATLRGLDGAVISKRKCRRHYGITVTKLFDPAVDSEEDSYLCQFTGKRLALGYVYWLIRKGEDIRTKLERPFAYEHAWVEGTESVQRLDLWACTMDEAPERSGHSRVERIGQLTFDLAAFDLQGFDSKISADTQTKVYYLDYDINLILGNREATLTVTASAFDRELGSVEIQYERRQVGDICSICLINLREDVVTTECNHKFHDACLQLSLTNDNRCPLCRQPITTPSPAAQEGGSSSDDEWDTE